LSPVDSGMMPESVGVHIAVRTSQASRGEDGAGAQGKQSDASRKGRLAAKELDHRLAVAVPACPEVDYKANSLVALERRETSRSAGVDADSHASLRPLPDAPSARAAPAGAGDSHGATRQATNGCQFRAPEMGRDENNAFAALQASPR
jgi:hypothetical protein